MACKAEEINNLRLNEDYNSILDYEEIQVCVDPKDLTCLEKKDVVQYLYITDQIVVDDLNERLDLRTLNLRVYEENKRKIYRAYIGQPFIKSGDVWFETGYNFVDKQIWESYTSESLLSETIGRLNPLKIYSLKAQSYATTEDGMIVLQPSMTWSTVRNTGTVNDYNKTSAEHCIRATKYANNYYYAGRAYFPFDLSAVTGEIESASFNWYSSDAGSVTSKTMYLVDWQPHSSEVLTVTNDADIDNLGEDAFSSIAYNTTPETLHSMEFSATSTANINLGGYEYLGLRVNEDFINQAPGIAETDGTCLHFSESTGTTYDPYLEITIQGEQQGTTTATSTIYASNCTPDIMNDITMVNACSYTSSTTGQTYMNYHVPFFLWVVFIVPFVFIFNQIIKEVSIFLRNSYD